MNVPPLITYPARPVQGGRLDLATPKRGGVAAVVGSVTMDARTRRAIVTFQRIPFRKVSKKGTEAYMP